MRKKYLLLILFVSFFVNGQVRDFGGTPVEGVKPINRTDLNSGAATNRTINQQSQTLTPGSPTGSSAEVGVTAGQLSVSLTGAANYSIPIAIPPGINGVVPQISLNYNSQGGNDVAGYGWSIGGLSVITRIPATKHHDDTIDAVDFDASDRFALDGQRLIVKNGVSAYGANGTVYETERFSNIKITSYGVSPEGSIYGPDYFVVDYPDGSKAYYHNRRYDDWAITYFENPQGIRISYFYRDDYNYFYNNISRIEYGSMGASTPINVIRFNYVRGNRNEEAWIGGINFYRNALLKQIEVIGNGLGYRNYELNHNTTSLGYSRLIGITEKSNGKSLNPTLFTYDTTPETIAYNPISTNLSVNNISYLNSVSVPGDFNGDGNMDFILYPTTGTDAKKKYWIFDNIQSGNYNIGYEDNTTGAFTDVFPISWLGGDASYGYKLMPSQGWAVVKFNNLTNTTTFKCHTLGTTNPILLQYDKSYVFPKFTYGYFKYRCVALEEDPGTPTWVNISKDIPKINLTGDFNGDGLTDVLVVEKYLSYSITQGCVTNTQTYNGGKTYFVNLDRRITTNYVNVAGVMTTTVNSKFHVVDYDGDGKSDVLVFDTGKVTVYSLDDNKQLVQLFVFSDLGINLSNPILLGDYNGDGKADFIIPNGYGNNYNKYTSTGRTSYFKSNHNYDIAYNPSATTNGGTESQVFHIIPNDFNADGKTDLILVKNSSNPESDESFITVQYFNNTRGGFFAHQDAWVTSAWQVGIGQYAMPVFMNFDRVGGNSDINFISKSGIFNFKSHQSNDEDTKLKMITLGNGVKEAITYTPFVAPLDDSSNPYDEVYRYNNALTENYPNAEMVTAPRLKIVSKLEKQGANEYMKQEYKYYGAVYNLEGLGFLGFRSTSKTNWYNDNYPVITNMSKFDFTKRGALSEMYTLQGYYLLSNLSPTSFITKSAFSYNDALLSNKVYKIANTNSIVYNSLEGTSKETVTDYNGNINNNPTSIVETYRQGTNQHKQVKTFFTYESVSTPTDYIIDRVINKKTQSYGSDQMDTEENYVYNPQHLLWKFERQGHNTNTITQEYSYDPFGNITERKISTPGEVTRKTNYEYDTISGRFLWKIIEVVDNTGNNLVTEFTYDQSTGLLLKELLPSDPNHPLKTEYQYDVWGKKVKATNYLGKSLTYDYSWLSPDAGYAISSVKGDLGDDSFTMGLYDDLGRLIGEGNRTLNEASFPQTNVSWKGFTYDIYGRIVKAYEPVFALFPTFSNDFSSIKYDNVGRIIQKVDYTGKTTDISYSGLTTTITTTAGGVVKNETITKDAVGNVVSKSDDGELITYEYYANGNLKKSDYNGNAVLIEQNGWGKKTKLTDPSAGEYNYSYNGYGELISETNLNGTTTYDLDNFGRLEEKTISGTNTNSKTTYDYDQTTKLLKKTIFEDFLETPTVTVTNEYFYDNYRRMDVSTEKGPLAEYEQRTVFDLFGRPEKQKYSSALVANGKRSERWVINTYKNGYLSQISDDTSQNSTSIAQNPVLWKADAVNARGQLTSATLSNGVAITNTYDQYGFSTQFRHEKTGITPVNICTLNTVFNRERANLESRSNNMFASNETFTYDNLDRLTEWGDYNLQLHNIDFSIGTGDFPAHNGATAVNENGSLKVTAAAAYSGVSKALVNQASIGDKITVSVKVNKGTTDKVRVLIVEKDQTSGQWNQSFKGYAQNGVISFEHVVTAYPSVYLTIDKDGVSSDVGIATNFYVDDLLVKKVVREKQEYDQKGRITKNNLGTYNYNDPSSPTKLYRNTSLTINPTSYAYYNGREGIFNDSFEENKGWIFYEPSVIAYDDSKSYTGKRSLRINNPSTTEKIVFSDGWISIDNATDTEYTYSGWVYSEGPQAEIFLYMKTPTETGYATLFDQVYSTTTGHWEYVQKTFMVPASIKKINIRLDNNGTGNIWFDDVRIRKTGNAATSVRKLNVSYNSFKSPYQIEETGVDKISFDYNDLNARRSMFYGGLQTDKYQRQMRKHYSFDGTMEIKHNINTGETEFVTYIGGDGYSAPVVLKSNGTAQEYLYLHRDYQGSILAISNQAGNVIEKRQFDPWGNIVAVQDGQGNILPGLTVLDRGYTGHEHLQSVGIVHMNGRLYDSKLHRFMQPDNYIQDPYNTQNYNRYAYVLNNPLKYVDYSGEEGEESGGPSNVEGGMIGNGIAMLAQNWDELGIKNWSNDNLSNGVKSAGNWLSNNLKSVNGWFDKNLRSIGDFFGGKSEAPQRISVPQFSNVQTGGGWQNEGFKTTLQRSSFFPPNKTDSFQGTWGKVNYFLSGGTENGGRYDWDGNYIGLAPTEIGMGLFEWVQGGGIKSTLGLVNEAAKVTQSSRRLWVLSKEGAEVVKNHKAFGTLFKSKSDGLWWAIDKAGHGGSRFKVFKETNKGLEWFKDADEFGNFIINKHKGPIGRLIPWEQLKTIK